MHHFPTMRRRLGRALLLALALLAPASARAWPDRTVTIVVPFPPGNAGDLIARLLAPGLSQSWGQPVVVQNLPGAAGSVGVERVARSAPDGHTLVLSGDAAIVVRPSMTPPLPYDPRRDLMPITLIARTPNLLVVRASDGPRSLADLVALARATPGGLNYGHGGPGTSVQLGAELLKQMAGLDLTGIGYPNIGGIVQEVLAGRVAFSFSTALVAGPLVRDGRLRALAVSSAERLPSFPDVPTVAEQGYPGFSASSWWGVLAPAGTPAPVIERIHGDIHAALAEPGMRGRLEGLGAIMVDNTPAEFAALIAAEIPRMAALLRAAGISAAQ